MIDAILCADIGTSSLKAALVLSSGEAVSKTRVFFNVILGSNRWLAALTEAAASLRRETDDLEINIRAISISGNGPSLANTAGSFLWNSPLDKNDIAAEVQELAPQGSLFLPRILHIKHHVKDLWNSDEQIFSVPEWLVYQLTGTAQTVLPEPRYQNAYWTQDDLCDFGLPAEKLPPFVPLGTSAGKLTPTAAEILGFTQDNAPEVFCGGPDFIAALIGTNTLTPGNMCDRAGTSEGFNLCTEKPLTAPGLRILPSPRTPLWNASIILPDSGKRFNDWRYNNLYADVSYSDCIKYLLKHPENEGYNLLLDIAFSAKKKIGQLITAAVAQGQALPQEILCTGGQAENPIWMQFKADVVGMPFSVISFPDAELIGDAAVAFYGLEEFPSIPEASHQLQTGRTTYYPDKEKSERYNAQYENMLKNGGQNA